MVVDTTLPTIVCATIILKDSATAEIFALSLHDAHPSWTNRVIVLGTITNALCGSTFSATRTWAAIDACNNTNTCTQTEMAVDTTLPTIVCPTNNAMECGTAWTFDPPSAPADACGTNQVI